MMSNEEIDIGSPLINTHALGKSAFCDRAGIIAIESGMPDDAEDAVEYPRLTYIPIFDDSLINQKREQAHNEAIMNAALGVAVISVAALLYSYSFLFAAFLMFAFLVLFASKAYIHFQDYRELSRRLSMKASAEPAKLGDTRSGVRIINWWGLCKDDEFQSTSPLAAFSNPELGLSGKPARIATYRGGRIPVILHSGGLDAPKPYHKIRLAAYSLLIEKNQTGGSVNWGIVLDPATMRGLAIPITSEMKLDAVKQIKRFRRQVLEVRNGTDPVPPPESYCRKCPHGHPRASKWGAAELMLNGKPTPPFTKKGTDGRQYHCACGDRFKWVPPHELAHERGLR